MVDERRVRPLNTQTTTASGPVVYVMARDQRVHDNWALFHAKEEAAARGVPFCILFVIGPMFLHGSARHNQWLIESLKDVARECKVKNIPFYIEHGEWNDVVVKFAKKYEASLLVFDFNPLEPVRSWREQAAKESPCPVHEVDAHNVIPCWFVSDKVEFAAHTLRPKIHKCLNEFLVPYPRLVKQAAHTLPSPKYDWKKLEAVRGTKLSDTIVPTWLTPGECAAKSVATLFVEERLNEYADKRNDPNEDVLSNLSPYLRWGNISAQRIALMVEEKRGTKRDNKDAFLEELIVRRELSDNFVYYNPHYNSFKGAEPWAQKTLEAHRKDIREYTYSYKALEEGKTHDPLWNAAQQQMVTTGKMHGYMRMYWAKKILEWTKDVETAIKYALTLNDIYELDGRNSNGVVGVMWSICGVHDRAWTERPVFGKIRYMNYNGAKRKFDVDAYIKRYSTKTTT